MPGQRPGFFAGVLPPEDLQVEGEQSRSLRLQRHFAFGHEVRRVRGFRVPGSAALVLVAGGVRSELSLHLLRRDGLRRSLRFRGARLLRGFERPIVDSRAELCALLTQREGRVWLRVYALDPLSPLMLFERELSGAPERFALELIPGSARISVRAPGVRMRAPGQLSFEAAPGHLGFLHPRARCPVPSRLLLDFGRIEVGTSVSRSLELRNPGELALQLAWQIPQHNKWSLTAKPSVLRLAPQARGQQGFVLGIASEPGRVELRLPLRDTSREGEPLLELVVRAEAFVREDADPPSIDVSKVQLTLQSARSIRVRGRAGAVRDMSPPVRVRGAPKLEAVVAGDGSFELLVPRAVHGRVVLTAEDAHGHQSRPVFVGRVRDEQPPELHSERIRLSALSGMDLWIRGRAGALRDLSPPLQLSLLCNGKESRLPERPEMDGSFVARARSRPGDELVLRVYDSAVPRRHSDLNLGRALPFLRAQGGMLHLHGHPHARFRLESYTGESEGAAPVLLARLQGRFDAKGRARLARPRLRGGVQLLLEMEDRSSGRFGAVSLPVPR
ncbi:MAG: hypothetical protein CSA62_11910 [Planctomycetota bacterium]|nr:MAG: hypothetical protein CSA62_11910 [Planctomycetota bacterium]